MQRPHRPVRCAHGGIRRVGTTPRGGIHALVGQNGAGKTTLARVLAGLQAQDHGTVEINGTEIPAGDHRTARRAGVDMVYQYASLVPGMTVAEALELWAPRRALIKSPCRCDRFAF